MSDVLGEIRRQAHWCEEFGSPFTAQLLKSAAADLAAGGIIARLTADWPGNARELRNLVEAAGLQFDGTPLDADALTVTRSLADHPA